MNQKQNKIEIQNNLNTIRKSNQIKTWLIIVLVILIVGAIIFLLVRGKGIEKIIPWLKNIPQENLDTNTNVSSPSTSGMATMELANQVSVTLPTSLSLYSGFKEKLNLSFENSSSEEQTVDLAFTSLPYTYIEDKTSAFDDQNQRIDLTLISLNPNETKEVSLPIQSVKVWDNYFTLYLNEKSQKIDLAVTIKEKTPLFGKDTDACATSQPFLTYFGPDCGDGECDGLTSDKNCISKGKKSNPNTCYPYQFEYDSQREDGIINQCQESLKFNSQITRNAPINWGNMVEENHYAWEKADWYIDALANKVKAQQGLPSGIMGGDGGWAVTCSQCTNPDGSKGFFDLNNDYLTGKFIQYVKDVSARYGNKLNYYEMANEPAAEFFLCPCSLTTVSGFQYVSLDTPTCTAASGPNQPVCAGGGHAYQQDFADAYGDYLAGTVKIASAEIKKNNPQALIVTGAIDDQNGGLTPITQKMIEQGILDNDNVAIGIHQYPHNGLQQGWSSAEVNCTYYQKPDDAFWLPEECEKAPPFSSVTIKNKSISMSRIWAEMDSRYDASEILKDLENLGVLDKTYFFDSELHAGFSNPDPKYDLTEAIAGVRIGAVNAHQKFLGTIYVLMPDSDFSASVFNLMVQTLTGVTPVYQWESKLMGSNYTSVVYKLFTRGQEDILIFWSNDNEVKTINLETKKFEVEHYQSREMIGLDADQGATNFIDSGNYLDSFNLKPVKEIKIVSVLRNSGTPFDWLTGINY